MSDSAQWASEHGGGARRGLPGEGTGMTPPPPGFEQPQQVDRLNDSLELLREVANSGVVFEDPRIGYVEVQIDRVTWDELAPYRKEQR